jgi:signal transduction histidine kinase
LVTAREEERRRLRRDLHDGLGPALASLTLKLDAARNLLARDRAATETLLLDELGLVSAIREHAARNVSANGLRVLVEAPESLPPLPAAVEVAAYRITMEALTNVARHAQAHTCVVRLSLPEAGGRPQGSPLQIEIVDDGVGLPADRRAGVGLTSVRERAAEIGGTCAVGPGPGGGTRVVARRPPEKKPSRRRRRLTRT